MASLKDKVIKWSSLKSNSAQSDDSTFKEEAVKLKTRITSSVEKKIIAPKAKLNISSQRILNSYLEKKAKLHQDIINKLDLSVIEVLSPEQLKAQLHELVISLINES